MKKLSLSFVLLLAMVLQLFMLSDVSIAQTTDPVVLYRVNNGGPQIAAADASSPDWSEDQVESGTSGATETGTPSPYVNSGEINPHAYGVTEVITLDGSVPAAAPPELFQVERWDDDTAPEMQWDFPIPVGTEIEIRLYLAEIFDGVTGVGQREFDVSVEGTVPAEFDNLDPYDITGGLYIGTMVSTTTTVLDGNLDLDFIHIADNPAIKGIEIIQLTAGPTPEALIEVNPGGDLFASTFTGGSFQIHNTGEADIVSMTLDLSTAWMMDVVFDPEGTAGDAAGKCLTVDSGGAATGFVAPSDPCTDPFSVFHNGTDADDGYDVLTVNFTDFNPGESFTFSADLDPTSIKDATDTGDAGAISGFEIIGASVSVEFSGGVVLDSNLYDEGSLGGSAATMTTNEAPAPTIDMQGVTVPTVLSEAGQTVLISGTPGANFSILQPVARLYLDENTPGGYDIDPFESNEALAKTLYSGTFDGSGNASVPVTLFIQSSPDTGPDAPLNHFIAVEENAEGDYGLTSNSFVVVLQEAICINVGGDVYTTADGLFYIADTYFTDGSLYDVTDDILNTEDDPLFQTERYGDPFSYSIPVDNGDYDVELMFAELFHGVNTPSADVGDRIFSVDLEGATVLSEYDIIAETGAPLTAITETFPVTVSDGFVDLSFYLGLNGIDNAKVSAICVSPANQPPTADAGEDQTVTDTDLSGDEVVTLDGSGSSDSDGTIVSYSWDDGSGEIATGVTPTVTLPVGTHTITLTVTDDDGDTDTDEVSITVNAPPTADAGMDQTVTDEDDSGDELITLDGSGSSDSDGSIVSYSWDDGGGEIATGVNPTVTLPVGTHTITLTVTDDDGLMDTDTVTITIQEKYPYDYYLPLILN